MTFPLLQDAAHGMAAVVLGNWIGLASSPPELRLPHSQVQL